MRQLSRAQVCWICFTTPLPHKTEPRLWFPRLSHNAIVALELLLSESRARRRTIRRWNDSVYLPIAITAFRKAPPLSHSNTRLPHAYEISAKYARTIFFMLADRRENFLLAGTLDIVRVCLVVAVP